MRAEVSIRDGISAELDKIIDNDELLSEIALTAAQVLVEQGTAAFTRPNLRPSPWPDRKDNKPHPLLQLSKSLSQSLTAAAVSGGAIIGSDREYAAVHQYGSTKLGIPARPFFPFGSDGAMTPQAERLVNAAANARLRQILGRTGNA